MPPARKKATRPAARTKKATQKKAHTPLDRLDDSLDAAQKALGDLRKELGRGGRDLLKGVQKMVGDARRDTRRLNKTLRADLGEIGGAIRGRGKAAGARSGASKKTTKPAAAKRTSRSGPAKRTTRKSAG